jgi:hypothetical protein
VAPGGVGVAVLLQRALTPTLGDKALTVGECGEVGGVDGDVLAHAGIRLAQASDHAGDACVKQVLVLAQLRGEAIARPFARRIAFAAERSL